MAKEKREPRYPEASVASHAATGGIEGAVGIYGTEPLWRRYVEKKAWHNPFKDSLKGHARKIAIGAVVGAAATAPIGMIVEEIRRHKAKRAQQATTNMEAGMDQALTEFRKLYKISEDQEGEPAVVTLPSKSRILAGLSGAGIGAAAGAAGGATLGLLLPGLIKRLGKGPAKFAHKIEAALGGPIGTAAKIGIPTAGIAAHQSVMNVNEDLRESEAIKKVIRQAKREGRKEHLEAIHPGMINLGSEEPYAAQKSGYRLDKYKKTIKAKEIDRKISDQVRAAALGAAGGALFPKGGSVGRRAGIGALAGSAVTAGVQYNTPKDVYGEQSETAKVVQRRVIQAGGAAAILGGLLARKRQIMSGLKKHRFSSDDVLKDLIEFGSEEPKKEKRTHNIAAGLALAAPGLLFVKPAFKMARVQARLIAGAKASKIASFVPAGGLREKVKNTLQKASQAHGQMAADYIEAAHGALGTGIQGRVVDATLKHVNAKRGKSILGKHFGRTEEEIEGTLEHYGKFRAGGATAVKQWAKEIEHPIHVKATEASDALDFAKYEAAGRRLAASRKNTRSTLDEISKSIDTGLSEREAVRKALNNPENPLASLMIRDKSYAVPHYTGQLTAAAGVPIVAGAGVAATTRKEKKSKSKSAM